MFYPYDSIVTCMANVSIYTFIHLNRIAFFTNKLMTMTTPPPNKTQKRSLMPYIVEKKMMLPL